MTRCEPTGQQRRSRAPNRDKGRSNLPLGVASLLLAMTRSGGGPRALTLAAYAEPRSSRGPCWRCSRSRCARYALRRSGRRCSVALAQTLAPATRELPAGEERRDGERGVVRAEETAGCAGSRFGSHFVGCDHATAAALASWCGSRAPFGGNPNRVPPRLTGTFSGTRVLTGVLIDSWKGPASARGCR